MGTFLTGEGKGKGTVRPRRGHEDPKREQRYSSTLSLTTGLDGVFGQRHVPAALPPGKTRYPLYWRLDGTQGRSGRVQKISTPPGFDLRTVHPVASRYTGCNTPAHQYYTTLQQSAYLDYRDKLKPEQAHLFRLLAHSSRYVRKLETAVPGSRCK